MSFETKNPAAARELLESDDGWKYVDVRTVEEYEQGHVPGAYNVPAFVPTPTGQLGPNPEFAPVMQRRFDASDKLVLGCAAGVRSQRACETLDAAGFQNLVNMWGGFLGARDMGGQVVENGWQACGFPVDQQGNPERAYAALRKDS